MDVAERLLFKFEGEGSGAGELTWGQQTVMRGVDSRNGAAIWLTAVRAIPDGTTAQDMADEFSFVLGRYQSMRTQLRFGDDGQVQQVVSTSGESCLEVVDAPEDADPYQVAKTVEKELEVSHRDYVSGWPIRVVAVRHRGRLAYRVIAMCHLVADGFGVIAMMSDMEARNAGQPPGPVTAMEPLEEARYQASPAGQRRSQAAERHWEHTLRAIPARRFCPSDDPREPRYWMLNYSSPAMFLAIQPIAARVQVDTSPVLLAAFAVGIAKVGRTNPAVPRLMVSNRFRPRLADSVAPLTQTCLCPVDVAGVTFDEAVTRAYRASMAAGKNAYFVPARIRELVALVSAERGEDIDVALVFNDRRMGMVTSTNELLGTSREVTVLPGPEQVLAARSQTSFRYDPPSDQPTDIFHVHVMNSPDTISIMVAFDTHYASPGQVEAVVREMEAITVAAAFGPDAPTGVAPQQQ